MTIVRAPDASALAEAAAALRSGRLVAFPTETVYGLGGNATDDAAVAAIYAAKGRPALNPLIIHLPDVARIEPLAVMDDRAHRLARAFWPGPLTIVLPLRLGAGLSPLALAGLDTVAVRVPAHPIARALLQATGLPVAGPSANISGRLSPTTAEHVAQDLGISVAMVLDGGACQVGVESTVIDLSRPGEALLLRPGGLPRDAIEALTGPLGAAQSDPSRPSSPGQLLSHYAPRLPVRPDATAVRPDEALLAFGSDAPGGALLTANLSTNGDPAEAARNLFAMMRALDHSGAVAIAVVPIPGGGLAEAIRDRLRRAAAPRG